VTKLLSEILNVTFIVSLLTITLKLATPILLAAIGDTFSQRSGILNLGLEGVMIMGALAAFLGTFFSGSLIVGLLCAIIVSTLFNLFMGYLSISLNANQIIAGTAITILGLGLSAFSYRAFIGVQSLPPQVEPFKNIAIPLLSDIPILGPILFNQNVLVYFALIMVVVAHIIMNKTVFGLKVKAVGENPKAADSKGISVKKVRYAAMAISGAMTGLAGAFISVGYMNMFIDSMTQGRGFIAISVVVFAGWSPKKTFFGAVLFAGVYALQSRLQAIGVPVPFQFLLALPYILTITVLVMVSKKAKFPAAYTLPFYRGRR